MECSSLKGASISYLLPLKLKDLWGKGGHEIVRARSSEHLQQNSTCRHDGASAHRIHKSHDDVPKTGTLSNQPKPRKRQGRGSSPSPYLMSSGNWWLLGKSQFSSRMQLPRCYLCPSRWSYTHAHAGSTNWTPCALKQSNYTRRESGGGVGEGLEEREWGGFVKNKLYMHVWNS